MRINYVDKAAKDQGKCEHCGQAIPKGYGYKWIKPRYGGKRRRHLTCPSWRPSEMTSSKMSGVLAAQEGFDDFLSGWNPEDGVGAVTDALSTAADEIRGVAEEYRESAQNIEDGFGHEVYMSQELNEKADELESWADDVENANVSEEPEACGDEKHTDAFIGRDTYECEECETNIETWADEVRDTCDVVQDCPV
jgi:hypothetical protein